MANPRYNQQVTNRRGAMKGGRMKKMGGGMMNKRTMLKDGSLKMVMKDGKKVPFFAADGKGSKDLGRANMKKGSIPPQLKKFVMAKKKKAKMKKNKKKVIG